MTPALSTSLARPARSPCHDHPSCCQSAFPLPCQFPFTHVLSGLSNKLGRARSKNLGLFQIFKQKYNVNVLSVARCVCDSCEADCARKTSHYHRHAEYVHDLSSHLLTCSPPQQNFVLV